MMPPFDGTLTVTLAQLPQLFARSQEFAFYYRNNFLIDTLLPLVSLSGIYFWHWGLVASTLMGTVGMIAGLLNTTLPLLQTDQARVTEPAFE